MNIHACIPGIVWFLYDLHTVHIHTHHTSEVSSHLFIQAVELLSVFESGGMWHGPVAGTSNHGGHHRGGRGSGAERQTSCDTKIQAEHTTLQEDQCVFALQKRLDKINEALTVQKGELLSASKFQYVFLCVYLLDPRSSSDEALFIPAGALGESPSGEE